mgnify:CR=1 FL=1
MHHDPHAAPAADSYDRRKFLGRSTATLAAAGAAANLLAPVRRAAAQAPAAYTLPKLPYDYAALEPHIDAETMMIHHTKHHQAYIDKLLDALKQHPELLAKSPTELVSDLEAVPEDIRTAVRNHGGGHVNHSFFWKIMGPDKGGKPSGPLAAAIDDAFGDFDKFKEKFAAAGAGQFGSGWAWLVKGDDGLEIVSTANQDSPLSSGKTPILGVDVWEHAYYLKYRNVRGDYLNAWWNVVDWDQAAKNFAEA